MTLFCIVIPQTQGSIALLYITNNITHTPPTFFSVLFLNHTALWIAVLMH